jgi:glucose-1-phosphate adenylyltransferase
VVAYPFTGYWNDIGTVRSFFDTNIMLAQPKPEFNLYDPAMPLYTNARMLPPAKITRSTGGAHAIIGEGSVIVDSEITDSVIGIRSYIEGGTRIHRTVILGSDYYSWQDPEAELPRAGPGRPGVGRGHPDRGRDRRPQRRHRPRLRDRQPRAGCRRGRGPASTSATGSS